MKTKGLPRSTPRVVLHEGGWRLFRACLAPAYAWAYIQSPLAPAKDVVFPGFLRVPTRTFHWMVGTSWGEGRGNTLIPPTAHPKMRPRREISSQRKESHQSHWTAVLFAHSRWRDFLSLCLYYAVVCGFIMDWVGTAQKRTRVIVCITSVQIVGYDCLPPVIFSLFSRIAVIHDGLRLGVPAGISCGPPGCLAGWMDRGASRPPSSPLPFCEAQRPEQRKPRETPR